MKINSKKLGLVVVGSFCLVILLGMVAGIWKTEMPGLEVTLSAGESYPAPEEIKGYMTFKELSKVYNIPTEEIFKDLGVPANENPDQPIKDVGAKYGFETSKVRELIAKCLSVQVQGVSPCENCEEYQNEQK